MTPGPLSDGNTLPPAPGGTMRLARDIPEFAYAGLPGQFSLAYLRIFLPTDALIVRRGNPGGASDAGAALGAVVVVSEHRENPGASITNTTEQWSAAAWRRFLADRPLTRLVWIEHYPFAGPPPAGFDPAARVRDPWPWEVFSEIRFAGIEDAQVPGYAAAASRQLTGPRWLARSRAWVEGLIGGSFPVVRDSAYQRDADTAGRLQRHLQTPTSDPANAEDAEEV